MDEKSPEFFMKETLALAREGLAMRELPIAAIVVSGGEIIAKAVTAEARERRLLVHAEYSALEQADKLKLSFEARLKAKLFTNLEPCLMCVGAAMSFYLGEIYYALESPSDGAIDLVKTWVRKEEDLANYQLPKITGGLLRGESIELFKEYVAQSPPSPIRDWAETLTKL
jgi:tRNA(adenine34) deaminase